MKFVAAILGEGVLITAAMAVGIIMGIAVIEIHFDEQLARSQMVKVK